VPDRIATHPTAFVPIQRGGCSNRCSFCIVPFRLPGMVWNGVFSTAGQHCGRNSALVRPRRVDEGSSGKEGKSRRGVREVTLLSTVDEGFATSTPIGACGISPFPKMSFAAALSFQRPMRISMTAIVYRVGASILCDNGTRTARRTSFCCGMMVFQEASRSGGEMESRCPDSQRGLCGGRSDRGQRSGRPCVGDCCGKATSSHPSLLTLLEPITTGRRGWVETWQDDVTVRSSVSKWMNA
jgi:hypothetical protein